MKIYFNSAYSEIVDLRDTSGEIWVKGDNGHNLECFFESITVSSSTLTPRLVIEWADGTTTNELPLFSNYLDNCYHINLPTLEVSGETQFQIRLYDRTNSLRQTAIFSRVVKESLNASDDTNITPAEYQTLMNAMQDLSDEFRGLEEDVNDLETNKLDRTEAEANYIHKVAQSVVDGNITVFDGALGNKIKDSGYKASDFALQNDLNNLSDVVSDTQDDIVEIRGQQTTNTNDISNLKQQASDFDSRITYNADSIGYIESHYVKKEDITKVMEYQHSVSSIEQILENPVHMGVYNVTEPFTSDSRFIDGGNVDYPKGTNVLLKINVANGVTTYTFDVLGGVINLDNLGGSKIFSSLRAIGYEEPDNDFELKDFADYCSNFEEGARVFLTHADFVSGSYPILYQKIFNNGLFTITNTNYVSVEIVNLSENNEGGAMFNVRYLNYNFQPTLQENYNNKWNQIYPAPSENLIQRIAVADWLEANSIYPFKYQTTFQNANIDTDLTLVELINNDAILFMEYGFSIGYVNEINKTITLYALEKPISSVELLFRLEK